MSENLLSTIALHVGALSIASGIVVASAYYTYIKPNRQKYSRPERKKEIVEKVKEKENSISPNEVQYK